MSEKIKYIDAKGFENEVVNDELAIVDFYSTECPPCEALAAKFESLSEIYGDDVKFLKIFRQENRELAEALGIKGSPTLLFYKNGNRVGDVLTGGIKRADIIKNLDALLPESRVAELKARIKPFITETDLVVLGAGPAGLTAAIYASQAKVDTIIVDPGLAGGQVSTTHQVCNYPGFIEPVPGFMLTHYMGEQAKAAGVNTRYAVDVTSVDLKQKEVVVDGVETIRAKKIIIATGSTYRPLNVPGEKEYKGNGISYCATCDAKFYGDKDVIVIGGGNSAVEEALFITKFAKRVRIVHQFDHLQANKVAQEKAFKNEKIEFVWEHEPRKFEKRNGGMAVTVEDLKTKELKELETDGVFVFTGMLPNLSSFNGDLKLDEWGYIQTDPEMHTNVKDVFAAGDVATKRFRQITTAVADGTIAAIAVAKELDEEVG